LSTPTVVGSPANATDGANVELGNQTLTNRTVTVDRVTLPEGGYVVVHSGRYVFDGRPQPLGVSPYLESGTHRNVSVRLSAEAIPGGAMGHVAAVLYRDDGDKQFTRFQQAGDTDPPYTIDSRPVDDTATITVRTTTASTATTTTSATGTPPSETLQPSTTHATDRHALDPVQVAGLLLGGLFAVAAVLVLVTGRRGGRR
jgi:hypothetical protein